MKRSASASASGSGSPSLAAAVARGVAGGLVATTAMSVVMLAARRLGIVGKLAPEHITEHALDAAGVDRGEGAENAASAVAHFAYGAGNGVVFALVSPRVPGVPGAWPPVVKGVVFAGALLLVSYQGWIPAARILPPLQAQTTGGRWTLIASHLVYGAALAGVVERR
jgi:hypothetical protein